MEKELTCVFYINSSIITHIKGIIDFLSKDKQYNILICFQKNSIIYGDHNMEDIKYIYLNDNNNINEITICEFINLKNTFIFFSSHYEIYLNNLFSFEEIFENNYVLNVNYAFHIHKQLYHIIYSPSVFNKFYMTFHECEENYNDYVDFMKNNIENFQDNSRLVGSTKINYLLANNLVINKNYDKNSILFSFRWEQSTQNCTYDLYKNYIKEIIPRETNIKFIYRPHTLSKFDDLKEIKLDNFKIDNSIDYKDIFDESSFFISDLSTLLIDYLFYTKKPVILLKGSLSFDDTLNSFCKKIIDCFYISNDVNELNIIINNLLNGIDSKKELREKYAYEFNILNSNAFYNISYFIKEEYSILSSNNFKKEYWNKFYSEKLNLKNPSNFCLFIKQYLIEKKYNKKTKIIDIGCGNGRDLLEFKKKFKKTEGLDMSKQTINNLKLLKIKCYDSNMIKFAYNNYDILYSRFSLHTLTEPEIYIFIKKISSDMKPNSILCIETRSVSGTEYKDCHVKMVNFKSSIGENHERLLMSLEFLKNLLIKNDFDILYEIDSCGLAVFGEEDPYVLRIICKKI
jgi:tellurite methyltransferase